MWILFFILLANWAIADDYACHNEQGKIISKHQSIDGVISGLEGKEGCINVSREKLEQIDEYYKFDNTIISSKEEEKIIPLTKEEKDQVLANIAKEMQDYQDSLDAIRNKLLSIGFTDEEIYIIFNNRI